MPTILTDVEVRVLGCLVEKQVTTPEYYPLTLNALTLACNQKNNRQPVTSLAETAVLDAVESLREKNLVYIFYGSSSRVPKYKHVMPEILHLDQPKLALMCVLMLRGPQTIGELRERASRLYEFSGLAEAEETLNSLITKDKDNEPLVARLPRQPGQKEARFAHLLSGELDLEALAEIELTQHAASNRQSAGDRISQLEQQVESLSEQMKSLRDQFVEFKKQFE
jgi:uncharacterized protein YceH (UPF0502 family)